jgi:hypothetical protein
MFYKLDRQGLAPSTYYVGGKRCVSSEADEAWLAERQAESKAA